MAPATAATLTPAVSFEAGLAQYGKSGRTGMSTVSYETLPQSQSWLAMAQAGASRTGSIRSSVLNLTNTIIGAGMLGLPAAFASCGYVVGALMLAMFAFFSGLGLNFLSASADIVGRPASFRSVADRASPSCGVSSGGGEK